MKNNTYLTEEQTNEFILKYKESKDKKYLEALLQSNMGLLKKIVYEEVKSNNSIYNYEDYLQEAILCFITCVNKFDTNNKENAKFITYFYNSVSKLLKGYTFKMNRGSLNLKKNTYLKYVKAVEFERKYIEEHGIKPSNECVAKNVGVSIKLLKKYKNIFNQYTNVISLNDKTKESDNPVEIHEICKHDAKSIEDIVEDSIMAKKCIELIKNERHKKIIIMKFFMGMKTGEISKITGLSTNSVARIVTQNLKKIKSTMEMEVI